MTTDPRMDALPIIRRRLISENAGNDGTDIADENIEAIEPLLSSQLPDGSWDDICYDSPALKDWPPGMHLRRLLAMARAWFQPASSGRGDPAILAAVLRGLDRWYAINPRSENWWWNQIGAPKTLGEVLLYLRDTCDGSYIERAVPAFTCHRPVLRFTGQNMVWVAGIQVRHGVLLDDPDLVSQGFMLIGRELAVFPDAEGIQPDMSFHQHGKVLYSGGYGQGFAADVAHFAWLAHGTVYAWPACKIRMLSDYMLDGCRWMIRGRTFDYGACGREITRQGHSAARFFDGVSHMRRIPHPRQPDFAALAAAGMRAGHSYINGNRYFQCSDLMTHHRPEYYCSVRLTSDRIENADWACCGGEGRYCHHLAEGVTFLMRDGDEYRDLFPAWNWRQIPGATVEQHAGDFDPDTLRGFGEGDFCGGVSDGCTGCAAMDFQRRSLKARKAYFLFDDALLALGAGIVSNSGVDVVTTMNQCHWRDRVVMPATEKHAALNSGIYRLDAGSSFRHDGFIYHVFDGSGSLRLGPQSGAWSGCGVGSSAEETCQVLNAGLTHGCHPDGATYAYAVVSETVPPADRQPDPGTRFDTLVNTPAAQAVWDRRDCRGQAVFYRQGEVGFPDGQFVAVDRGCLLLYRRVDQKAVITLAEAKREAGMISLSLRGKVNSRASVSLPQANAAGTSLTLVLG